MNEIIGCVVTPVLTEYLDTLVERSNKYTTLVWPGRGGEASTLKEPQEWLSTGIKQPGQSKPSRQKAVPFLFRATPGEGPPFSVTHVSLSVYMIDENEYKNQPEVRDRLQTIRVERFHDYDWDDNKIKTWYVVTSAHKLAEPIPYENLWKLKDRHQLSPKFRRGRTYVNLPEALRKWYENALQSNSVLLSFPNVTRWKKFELLARD